MEVDVQIITYAPTVFYHCQHCEITFSNMGVGDAVHREQAREALPDDLRADFAILSDQIHELNERWGRAVRVRVIDAASLEGVWKSLRHRAFRYPAVVVGGRLVSGAGSSDLVEVVARQVSGAAGRSPGQHH